MITQAKFFGGANRAALGVAGTGTTVFSKYARTWSLSGVDATNFFQLEDARTLKKGLVLYLISETFSYPVKDGSGGVIGSTTANGITKALLLDNTTQAGVWRMKATLGILPGFAFDIDPTRGMYDADTGGSLITVDGTAIGRAEDQSSNLFHIIQATAGYRPLWKANILNGLPVIRWDGTDDCLRRNPFNIADLAGGASDDQMTIYSVHKATVAQSQRLVSSEDGGNKLAMEPAFSDAKLHFWTDSANQFQVATPGGYVNTWRTDIWIRNGNTASIESNGTVVGSGACGATSTGGAGALSIGGYDVGFENFSGDLARLLIYPSVHSSADQTIMRAVLRAMYATW